MINEDEFSAVDVGVFERRELSRLRPEGLCRLFLVLCSWFLADESGRSENYPSQKDAGYPNETINREAMPANSCGRQPAERPEKCD
jgi:hypothetical protein